MMHIEYVATIDSTNSELMRRAAQGDYQSVCLVAQTQTAGRGRLGRAWLSDDQALTFSIGLALSPKDWSGLSLAVGLCIAEQLHERVQIKWPNDLWVDGCKLAGILIETAAIDHRVPQTRYCVVGVGLNLQAPPDQPGTVFKTQPTGLQALLPRAAADQVLTRILQPLVDSIHHFAENGFKPLRPRFTHRDALVGRQISLSHLGGQAPLTGQYAGVDEHGALLLQTPSGLQTVISQEVSVCF
jgi:BirA family transcriptional regulator, biotin operon repressor / biotin---[acetyl-CoA-carboxylase] ligase